MANENNFLTIRDGVLEQCRSDAQGIIVIPESVKEIAARAFSDCGEITKIVIPNTVIEIGWRAFSDCKNLKEIELPDSITEIVSDIFPQNLPCLRVHTLTPDLIYNISRCNVQFVITACLKGAPTRIKPALALGFVMEPNAFANEERKAEFTKYLTDNAGKLVKQAVKYPILLNYLCENKLITAKDIDAYLSEAENAGVVEVKAIILDYMNSVGMSNILAAREEKHNAAEEYTERWLERQSHYFDETGISGMTFTVSGQLYKWLSRDDLLRYLRKYRAVYTTKVSEQTDYFVQGEKANPQRVTEAQELGVPIINEDEFNNIIGYRFADAEHITVPAWITRLYENAFENCRSLKSIFIPNSLATIDDHVFPAMINKLEVCTFSPQLIRALRGCTVEVIITDKLSTIPPRLKSAAIIGFVLEQNKYSSSERTAEYNKYISKNVLKLADLAVKYPELLDYICENDLLKAKDCEAFLDSLGSYGNLKNGNIIANYIANIDNDKMAIVRDRKKQKAEQYAKERLSRLQARKPEDGLRGVRFTISGNLKTWPSNVDMENFLQSRGAFLDSAISMKTDYLVSNDSKINATKVSRAKEIGIPILDENTFYEVIGFRFGDKEHITVPSFIKKVNREAFQLCVSLRTLEFEYGVNEIGYSVFSSRKKLEHISIPDSLEIIGGMAFSNCPCLVDVTIPVGVRVIGESAFSSCVNLSSLTISNGVRKIGGSSFSRCESLSDVFIPESVEEIGYAAFSYCNALSHIVCSDSNPHFYAESNCLVHVLKSQRVLVAGCNKSIIPVGVTVIGYGAFWGFRDISDVIIPSGVVRIESSAFRNCTGIFRIFIPETVKKIGHGAFEGCSGLREVNIPNGILEIRGSTFSHCTELRYVTIPGSVTSIEDRAFDGCKNIIIRAPIESYGAQYAIENNIPYESIHS